MPASTRMNASGGGVPVVGARPAARRRRARPRDQERESERARSLRRRAPRRARAASPCIGGKARRRRAAGTGFGPRIGPGTAPVADPRPSRGWGRGTHLRADRRHQRVGDARRRRQGQGAEGRGRERHRLRRRRARLPDARSTIVEAAVAACREPRFHHYSPTPGLPELRAAIAHKTKRDSGVDCAAEQVLVTNGGKHAVYNTFQVLLRPGRRGAAARAVLDVVSRGASRSAGGVPVVLPDHRGRPASASRSSSSRPRSRRARRRCCSSRRATRPARCTRPTRSRRSGAGRSSAASGSSPTRSTSTSPTTITCSRRCPALVPELADTCVILNGVAKTYAMTGLARRLDDRPARRDRGGHQPAVALHVERLERRAGAPRSPR